MKKRSKLLAAVLGAVLACASIGWLAGCATTPTHQHRFSRIAAVPSTCTTSGNIQHYKCDGCGKLFADNKGETELTEAETVTPPAHKPVWHDAAGEHVSVSNGNTVYYQCSECGNLYGDAACTQTVTLGKLPVPMFSDRTVTSALDFNGDDVFASTAVGGAHDPIASQQFVWRFFMGFNHDVKILKNYEPVEVHMNIHRTDAQPDYWQFVVYYRPSDGLVQLHYGGTNKFLTQEQTEIFKARNGFYFLFVRDGDTVHLYIEDIDGTPIKIADISGFTAGSITRARIAHFNGYYADEKHAGVIRDGAIALDTNDLDADRSNPEVDPPEDEE